MVQPKRTAARGAVPSRANDRPLAPEGFEEFFTHSFRELVATAMIAGAHLPEAEDAASKTLTEMLARWPVPGYPLAYARRAVVNNFIKHKTRGDRRVAQRLIDRGHVPHREGAEDDGLTAWEDDQWVSDVIGVLPPAQRAVMKCIAEGLHRDEIAEELGMSRETIRRHLCDARARLAELLNPDGGPRQPSSAAEHPSQEES